MIVNLSFFYLKSLGKKDIYLIFITKNREYQ